MTFQQSMDMNEKQAANEQPKTERAQVKPANGKAEVPAVAKDETQAVKVQKALSDMTLNEWVGLAPKNAFLKSGGTEEEFNREVNFAMQLIISGPNAEYLQNCAKNSPQHLVDAIKNIALTKLTLNPELKLGYLVPRKGKIYFQSSYMGKREIVLRSGQVKSAYAKLVRKGERFVIREGTNPEIKHTPKPFNDDAEILGGYWVAKLANGETIFGTMSKKRIDEIKSRSEAVKAGKGSPWDTDIEQMMLKTIFNEGFKHMPKTGISDDTLKVLEIDSQVDEEDLKDWLKGQRESEAKDFDDDGPEHGPKYTDFEVVK